MATLITLMGVTYFYMEYRRVLPEINRDLLAYSLQENYPITNGAVASNFYSNEKMLNKDNILDKRHSTGYVLALNYYEQMTSGSRNLQGLQCWAAKFNLSVVEPMVAGSRLYTPWEGNVSDGFWFHDMLDIDMWNQLSLDVSHSQLVPWDDFLTSAPRRVILVDIKYYKKKDKRKMLDNNHVSPFQQYKKGCTTNWDSFSKFLSSHHFQVVRKVCFNFYYSDQLTLEQFNAHLYGGHSPSSTTVIYWLWSGISRASRVMISNAYCPNTHFQQMVRPCPRLLQIAAKYHQNYLRNTPYLAIMLRLEKLNIGIKKETVKLSLDGCFSKLLEVWKEMQNESGSNTTFLAGDVGNFGSDSIHSDKLTEIFKNVFKDLYGPRFSFEDWEDSFQTVASTKDSGYIGVLQQVLAAQAKCIILMGGGSFQKHALDLYKQAHPHKQDQCIKIITECSLNIK